MAGTILKQLSTTVVADNTAMTAANSGFTSLAVASPSTAVVLAAAAMNESVGYRFTQSGAFQTNAFLDLAATEPIVALRIPFRYGATPTANTTWVRIYAEVAHSTNLGTFSLLTSNQMQFFEGASSGTALNVTSPAGSPMVPGNDYVLQALFNTTAQTLSASVYPRGSTTALFTLSGNLSGSMPAIAAMRFGIATASALTQVDTNSAFAIGKTDFLARTDLTATALAATLSLSNGTVTGTSINVTQGDTVTVTCGTVANSGNGNTVSYVVNWGDGATSASGTTTTRTHMYNTTGTFTVTVTPSQS